LAASSDKSIYKSSNTCDNSYSSFIVEERVLKVIDESGIELFPFEIARKVHAFCYVAF
jgi:hypothetical protein